MTRPHVPQDVLDAAHARKAAREAGDWPEADRLKGVIEAAGWRVVDRGADFALSPALAPDLREGGRVRYGASENVPSRLAEPDAGAATVVIRATDDGAAVVRTVGALRAHGPAGLQVLVLADAPGPETAATIEQLERDAEPGLEVIWTAQRLRPGASINAALRRAVGPVILLLDASFEPAGDIVTPLIGALADPGAAVAGAGGLAGTDVRDLHESGPGDVVALDGRCLAMRRRDSAAAGPLDERFGSPRLLAAWWSLVLRDQGEGHPARRAVALDGLPLLRHGVPIEDAGDDDRDRMLRRDRYRLLDAFGHRPDLLGAPARR